MSAIIQLFIDMTQVTWCPGSPPPLSLFFLWRSPYHDNDSWWDGGDYFRSLFHFYAKLGNFLIHSQAQKSFTSKPLRPVSRLSFSVFHMHQDTTSGSSASQDFALESMAQCRALMQKCDEYPPPRCLGRMSLPAFHVHINTRLLFFIHN
ncbi:hypothetical protein TNCV_3438651 [Trichonephila clavipes]|nr:hypothetical protein TNCV_3438651 [Trichonephila clavipes]